jgi:hypothetical protein
MKKKTEELNYYQQQAKNEFAFKEMLKSAKPDLYVIFDLLEQTGINYFVIIKVIRQLHNLAMGTGYGTVTIDIQKGQVLFIRGEDSDRLNEALIIKKPKL